MRTGDAGFTYLALLLWLALGGAGLAALGTQWSTVAQRERERELVFRGGQVRQAVARYWAAREPHELPPSPEALLEDRRDTPQRHHLRRMFVDPFAPPGAEHGGWHWLTDPDSGRLTGVASRREALHYLRPGTTAFFFVPPAQSPASAPTESP